MSAIRPRYGCDTIYQLLLLVHIHIVDTGGEFSPNLVMLTFTKTGDVREGWAPDNDKYDASVKIIRTPHDLQRCNRKRFFAAGHFRPDNLPREDFVFVLRETEVDVCVWVRNALLLCLVTTPRIVDTDVCFVQYMNVIAPVHKVDEALRCVCLLRDTG